MSLAIDTFGLDGYLGKALDRCLEWFQAGGASLFVWVEREDRYAFCMAAGEQAGLIENASFTLGEGIAGIAAEHGIPKIVLDPASDPLFKDAGIQSRAEIGSSMVLPLDTAFGQRIGVLNISRNAFQEPFNTSELSKAQALGQVLALAIGNARLVARTNLAMLEANSAQSALQSVIDSAGVGIVVLSALGVVTSINPRAREFFDMQEKLDWTDRSVLTSRAPSALQPVLESVMRLALDGISSEDVASGGTACGTWSVVGTSLPDGGATIAIHDLTVIEREREETARTKRLAEIGQMASAVAHEIRNPLTAIRSAAQMIRTDPEGTTEFTDIIESETLRLNALCDDFLNLNKPIRLSIESVDLFELASKSIDLYRSTAEESGVGLELIGSDSAYASADPHRVEQVLHNLIRNALDATGEGGKVQVTVSDGAFAVSDSGCGMTEEEVGKLFTPFHTTKSNGTGLGLFNVQRILEAHGASVVIDSRPGRGTRVEVAFNWEQSKAA